MVANGRDLHRFPPRRPVNRPRRTDPICEPTIALTVVPHPDVLDCACTETATMKTHSHQHLDSAEGLDLIREDFERHPGVTLEDLKRRASFSRGQRPAGCWSRGRARPHTKSKNANDQPNRCGLDRSIGNSPRFRFKPARLRYQVAARRRQPIVPAQRASESGRCRRRLSISSPVRWRSSCRPRETQA